MNAEYHYLAGDAVKTVTVTQNGDQFQVTVGQEEYRLGVRTATAGELTLLLEGQRVPVYIARKGTQRHVALAGQTYILEMTDPHQRRAASAAAAGTGRLEAAMPGVVLEVQVAEGDAVAAGDTLVLLEAMKMELRITAPYAGQVSGVHCAVGAVVERGQLLVELEPAS